MSLLDSIIKTNQEETAASQAWREQTRADGAWERWQQSTVKTGLEQVYDRYREATSNVASPYYKMKPQEFAAEMERVGVQGFEPLNRNKAGRFMLGLGNMMDVVGNVSRANQGIGAATGGLVDVFSDDKELIEASKAVGNEAFGGLASTAMLALGGPLGLAAAGGSAFLDSYSDNIEQGRGERDAVLGGLVAGVSMGTVPGVGKVLTSIGERAAVGMVGLLGKEAGKTATKITASGTMLAVREAGFFTHGMATEVAGIAVDSQRTFGELLDKRTLIPMIVSSTVFTVGEAAFHAPFQFVSSARVRASERNMSVYKDSPQARLNEENVGMNKVLDDAMNESLNSDYVIDTSRNLLPDHMYEAFNTTTNVETIGKFKVVQTLEDRLSAFDQVQQHDIAGFVDYYIKSHKGDVANFAQLKRRAYGVLDTALARHGDFNIAMKQAMETIDDVASFTYRDFPYNPQGVSKSLYTLYKSNKTELRDGNKSVVYHNAADDVTVLWNDKLKQNEYYVGVRKQTALSPEIANKHADGIRQGWAEFSADLNGIVRSTAEQGGVASSADVDSNVVGLLREMHKAFGIDVPIYVSTYDAATQKSLQIHKWHARNKGKGERGRATRIANGEVGFGLIFVESGKMNASTFSTLMHEFGHHVQMAVEKKHGSNVGYLKVLKDKFEAFKISGKTAITQGAPDVTFATKYTQNRRGNVETFPEWFADQFARWVTDTNAKPADSVQANFKDMVDNAKRFYELGNKMEVVYDVPKEVYADPAKALAAGKKVVSKLQVGTYKAELNGKQGSLQVTKDGKSKKFTFTDAEQKVTELTADQFVNQTAADIDLPAIRVTKPAEQAVITNPAFREFMDVVARRYYTNLVRDDDSFFRSLIDKYKLSDESTDALAKAMYENPDPVLTLSLEKAFIRWDKEGRKNNPSDLISAVAKTYTFKPVEMFTEPGSANYTPSLFQESKFIDILDYDPEANNPIDKSGIAREEILGNTVHRVNRVKPLASTRAEDYVGGDFSLVYTRISPDRAAKFLNGTPLKGGRGTKTVFDWLEGGKSTYFPRPKEGDVVIGVRRTQLKDVVDVTKAQELFVRKNGKWEPLAVEDTAAADATAQKVDKVLLNAKKGKLKKVGKVNETMDFHEAVEKVLFNWTNRRTVKSKSKAPEVVNKPVLDNDGNPIMVDGKPVTREALSNVDYEAMGIDDVTYAKVLHYVAKWKLGELTEQKGKVPTLADLPVLENMLNAVLGRSANDVKVQALKVNGRFGNDSDNKNSKIMYIEDKPAADKILADLMQDTAYADVDLEVQKVGNKYKIVKKFNENLTFVSYERMAEMSQEKRMVTELSLREAAEFDDAVNTWDSDMDGAMFFQDFSKREPQHDFSRQSVLEAETANELGNAGLVNAAEKLKQVPRMLQDNVRAGKHPELVASIDKVKSDMFGVTYADEMNELRKFAKYDDTDLEGFMSHVVGLMETKPDVVSEILEYAPDSFNAALRNYIKVSKDYVKAIELGEQLAVYSGYTVERTALKFLDKADQILSTESAKAEMARIVKAVSPGGIREKIMENTGKTGLLGKAYRAAQGNLVHLAMDTPELKPLAEAAFLEAREKQSALNLIKSLDFTDDAKQVRGPHKPDEVNQGVDMNLDTRVKFDDLVRLANRMDMPLNKLQETDEYKAWRSQVSEREFNLITRRFERVMNKHKMYGRIYNDIMIEVDNLTIAKALTTNAGMEPDAALKFVKVMRQTNPEELFQTMSESGLDPELSMHIMSSLANLDKLRTDYVEKTQSKPWWVSESRYKEFVVKYTTLSGDGPKSGMVDFDTREEAQAWLNQYDGKEVKVSTLGIEHRPKGKVANREIVEFADLIKSTAESRKALLSDLFRNDENMLSKVGSIIDDLYYTANETAQSLNHVGKALSRKFKPGRERLDMLEQQDVFMHKMLTNLTRTRTDAVYSLYKEQPKLLTVQGKELASIADQTLRGLRAPDTEAGRLGTKIGFSMTMLGNISSMVSNLGSLFTVLPPGLREIGGSLPQIARSMKRAMEDTSKYFVNPDSKFNDPATRFILDRMEREGLASARHEIDMDDSVYANDLRNKRLKDGNVVKSSAEFLYEAGAKMYAASDKVSAFATVLSAYNVIKENNPKISVEEAYKQAVAVHVRVNGAGGKITRPYWTGDWQGTAKTLAQSLHHLQSFSAATIANHLRTLKKGYVDGMRDRSKWSSVEAQNARKAFNAHAAITVGLVGLTGIPGAMALNKIVAKLFEVDVQKETEKWLAEEFGNDEEAQFFRNVAFRGLTYAFNMPVDLQSRLSVGGAYGFNAHDGYNPEAIFGGFGIAWNALEGLGKAYVERDLGKAFEAVAPAGFKRAINLWRNDGNMRAGNKIEFDPTMAETVGAILGFTPMRLRRNYDAAATERYFSDKQSNERKVAISKAAEYIGDGQVEEARKYLAQITQEIVKTTPDAEAKVVYNSLANSAAAIATTRKQGLPGYKDPYVQQMTGQQKPSSAKAYLDLMQTRAMMGTRPRYDQRRYNQLMMEDLGMMQQSPYNPFLPDELPGGFLPSPSQSFQY